MPACPWALPWNAREAVRRRRMNGAYKSKRVGTIKPTKTDWIRLAAYIDGEGCISTSSVYSKVQKWKSESIYVKVTVHNTDPRLIDWCLDRFGGRIMQVKQSNKKWSTGYTWQVVCQQARAILEQCLPYFLIKREQAEIAIALMRTQRRWGRGGMPQEIKEMRWEMRNALSALKGSSARIKHTQPRIIDTSRTSNFTGKDDQTIN